MQQDLGCDSGGGGVGGVGGGDIVLFWFRYCTVWINQRGGFFGGGGVSFRLILTASPSSLPLPLLLLLSVFPTVVFLVGFQPEFASPHPTSPHPTGCMFARFVLLFLWC